MLFAILFNDKFNFMIETAGIKPRAEINNNNIYITRAEKPQ
jgi:hypothetical protein